MMERMISTDDLEVKCNFEESEITIIAKIKDHAVFPEIAAEDKEKMSKFTKFIFDRIIDALVSPKLQGGDRNTKMIKVACGACGTIFETKDRCCGEKESIRNCTKCGAPNKI